MILKNAAGDIIFGAFQLDLAGRALYHGERLVRLARRALGILCVPAASRGEIFAKDALIGRVWPRAMAKENCLPLQIVALRKPLGGCADKPKYFLRMAERGGESFAGVGIEDITTACARRWRCRA